MRWATLLLLTALAVAGCADDDPVAPTPVVDDNPVVSSTFELIIDHERDMAFFTAGDDFPYDWEIHWGAPGSPGVKYQYTLEDRPNGVILLVDEGMYLIKQVQTGAVRAFEYRRTELTNAF